MCFLNIEFVKLLEHVFKSFLITRIHKLLSFIYKFNIKKIILDPSPNMDMDLNKKFFWLLKHFSRDNLTIQYLKKKLYLTFDS